MKRKRPAFKIVTKNKSYPIPDSVFYKLSSKQRLAGILFTPLKDLKALCGDDGYRCFIDYRGGKPREIQAPRLELDRIHSRVASLLCRIEASHQLHSGRKGRSNISNAKAHIGVGRSVVTVDIRSFYTNTTRSMIYDFFRSTLRCQPDVADLLSKILTYNDHVPTGSRVSMPLAYLANRKLFDELESLALGHGATITIYVDDLTFSGFGLQRNIISKIERTAKKFDHKIHPKKIRFFGPNEVKLVTGTAIIGDRLVPRNKHLFELRQHMQSWINAGDQKEAMMIANKVLGRINFMSSIDARYKDKARSFRRAAQR